MNIECAECGRMLDMQSEDVTNTTCNYCKGEYA